MSADERIEFDKWYDSYKGKEYNFAEEIKRYCCDDVKILQLCCIEFYRKVRVVRCRTLLWCFNDYNCCIVHENLSLFMKDGVTGIIPKKKGYGNNVNQSILALTWLSEIGKGIANFRWKLGVGGEMRIRNHYVDGYDPQNGIVYQFHGCFYHRCVKCFPSDGYNEVLQKRFGLLNEKTKSVTNYLKERGLTVVEKWECEYVDEKRVSAANIQNGKLMFGNNCPLCLRDVLYGGRTSLVWLQKKCVGKEKIHYVNFTLLYPSM